MLLRRWKRSGLSLQELAAENRLSAKTLAWWRWRLGRDARGAGPIELVEVKRELVAPASAAVRESIEVVLGNGIVVRVGAVFEEAWLERVVRTLGRC